MKNIIIILFIFFCQASIAQDLLKFNMEAKNEISSPVSVSLDGIAYNLDKSSLVLYELTNHQEQKIPCQLESGHLPDFGLFWMARREKMKSVVL
jgi:hypothetical protein